MDKVLISRPRFNELLRESIEEVLKEEGVDEINWKNIGNTVKGGLKSAGDFLGYKKGDGLIGNAGNIYGTMQRRLNNVSNTFNNAANKANARVKLESIRAMVNSFNAPYNTNIAHEMGIDKGIDNVVITNFIANGGDVKYPDIKHTLTSMWRLINQNQGDSQAFKTNFDFVMKFFKVAPATREALSNERSATANQSNATSQANTMQQTATTGAMPTQPSQNSAQPAQRATQSPQGIQSQGGNPYWNVRQRMNNISAIRDVRGAYQSCLAGGLKAIPIKGKIAGPNTVQSFVQADGSNRKFTPQQMQLINTYNKYASNQVRESKEKTFDEIIEESVEKILKQYK